MCGRITQGSGELPGLVTVEGYGDSRVKDPRDWVRFNGAPSQDFWIVRRHPETDENQRDRMTWGLIPYWSKDGTGGRKPINAKAETVAPLPTFRDAYQHRRCLVPFDNFFEWKAIKGQKTKQPYAIAMKVRGAICPGRHLAKLESPPHRRVDAHFLHHHADRERACGADTRPHAGYPPARSL